MFFTAPSYREWRLLTPVTCVFFFNDTATPEIYTLSLHDALPICRGAAAAGALSHDQAGQCPGRQGLRRHRSEEHTSELQSQSNLVCRLLLEKKKGSMTHPQRNASGSARLPSHRPRQTARSPRRYL